MRQLDIQLECVAAAYVGDRWYFASNNLVIINPDVTMTLKELGTPNARYQIVQDQTSHMHAEMKILKYLNSKGIALKGVNMGVSKPCCPKCKEILEAHEVAYMSYHNESPERWTDPF